MPARHILGHVFFLAFTVTQVHFTGETEMFLVRGKLVATQPFFYFIVKEEFRHEVKHFFCRACGEEWGTRVSPSAVHPPHSFHKSRCRKCGGSEDMLSGFEWRHLNLLSPSVLAYTFLQLTAEENS